MTPNRQIRASHNDETIRVYQAYSDAIADTALTHGTFVEPAFKMTRMTWIKPSFLWMMYRSGWAAKDSGQHRVLGVDITRAGFEWALANSCLSHQSGLSKADARRMMEEHPVRIQWDPERDLSLAPLDHRSIQIGLRGEAVQRYVHDWIVQIEDLTETAHEIRRLVVAQRIEEARELLPAERPYKLAMTLAEHIGADG